MMIRSVLLGAAALALAACGGDDSHGVSTDPNAATGFITANSAPPSSAEIDPEDGVPVDADGRPYQYAFLGKRLPHFAGQLANERKFYSSITLSRWTVIDVWGIWCGDCMADAPYVAELADRLKDDDSLDFISIHTPPSAVRADEAYGKFGSVERYFEVKGYSYPTVLDTDAKIRDLLQIGWTPSYLLVSPDGVVRGYRTDLSVAGDTPVDDFLRDIKTVQASVSEEDMLPDAASNKGLIVMGPEGVGGISGTTLFTLDAIKAAFPDHDVISATVTEDEEGYPIFVVKAPETTVQQLIIEPSWDRGYVSKVFAYGPSVIGPDGEVPGETWFSDLPDAAHNFCTRGLPGLEDRTVCGRTAEGSFFHVYKAPGGFTGTLRDAPEDIQTAAILESMYYAPGFPISE